MRIYIVEDDESLRMILESLLHENFAGITAIEASERGEEALQNIPAFSPDLLLVDISLPGIDGIEMIRRLRPQCPNIRIVVLTGHEVEHYQEAARQAGADDIVSKWDDDKLLHLVRELQNHM